MSIGSSMLPEFDEEFAGTRAFLERVPDDKLTWKPHEKSMELGRLAWHLTDFPEWCRNTLKLDSLKLTAQDGAELMRGWQGKRRAHMLARFDRDLPEARTMLLKTTDEEMAHRWQLAWDGQVFIDGPREQVLRKWTLNHMIHHRAQLGVYFRLNDIAIPGVYGPSADDAQ